MLRTLHLLFRCLVPLGFLLSAATAQAAGSDKDVVPQDFFDSSWTVQVEGDAVPGALSISGGERMRDGLWSLDVVLRMGTEAASRANAELIVSPDGYALRVTSDANGVIFAKYDGTRLFTGTITTGSGKVLPVRLEKALPAGK